MLNWKLRNERAALIAGGACFSALGRCALRIRDPQPEPRQNPSSFPIYWLFNRDPDNRLL